MTIAADTPKQEAVAGKTLVIWLPLVAGSALAMAVFGTQHPLWLFVAVVAATSGVIALRHTGLATLAVIFILYTNASVVAVKFHGVPKIVGAAVPLLLIVPLMEHLWLRRQRIVIPPATPLILLFLAVQLLGVFFAVHPEEALASLIVLTTEGLALYVLIVNLIRTPRMLRAAVWTLLLAGIFMGGVPLCQQITRTHDNDYGGFAQVGERAFSTGRQTLSGAEKQARSSGSIGEKNRYAQVMLMLVPLGVICMAHERSRVLRALALVALGVLGIGAALAFSRGAAVGFALTVCVAAGLGYIRWRHLGFVLIAVLLTLVAVPQYRGRLMSLGGVVQRMTGRESWITEGDGAFRGRATEMGAAGLVFLDHPIIGVGPGMFKYYAIEYGNKIGIRSLNQNREAHSLYLDVAAQNGVLGLLCLAGIVGVTLRDLHRTRRRLLNERPTDAAMATGFFLVIVMYLMTGLFLHFAYIRYFWLMMALATSAVYCHPTTPDEVDRSSTAIDPYERA